MLLYLNLYLWQFESFSREDLLKLVRKQQAQLETRKKEAEESAKQTEVSYFIQVFRNSLKAF
jgi:hypothetical protein